MSIGNSVMGAAGSYSRSVTWLEPIILFLMAFSIRLIDLDHAYGGNELFHLLAARSWADEGTLRVAHGLYERNGEFSILLAWLGRMFGESPEVMRMPSVIAGSLSVTALFVWVRSVVGRPAAWIAALLLVGSPLAIIMSRWIRVYAIQALVFFLGAVGIYTLLTRRHSQRVTALMIVASVAALWLSLHLRFFAILGIAGIGIWAILELRALLIGFGRQALAARWFPLIAVTLLGIVAAIYIGIGERLLKAFVDLQPQAAERGGDLFFYHDWLLQQYPLWWAAFPLLALFVIAREPKFGLFCTSVFLTVFVVYMLASRKQLRYLYFILPFLFALWGCATAELLPQVKKIVGQVCDALGVAAGASFFRRALAGIFYGSIAVFVLALNAIVLPTYYRVAGTPDPGPNWIAAERVLSPWLRDERAVIVTAPMQQPLYYFGRADIEFGPKYIYESDTTQEFGLDERTGLRTISSRSSFERVFLCYERGLFIMVASKWRKPGFGPDDDVVELLEARARAVPLDKQWGLKAYAWEGAVIDESADCSVLEPSGGQT